MNQTHESNSGYRQDVPSVTSIKLLEGVKRADPDAWQRLSRLYGPLVYRWCRHAGIQTQDAADVVQEVFVTVAARVHEFERQNTKGSFRAWLKAITRNKIGDFLRRSSKSPDAFGGTTAMVRLQEMPDAIDSTSTDDQSAEDGLPAHGALELVKAEFEDRTWQAFWRTAVECRSPADVAADMGMTLHAVYKAKSRVLCRLRQELDGLPDPEADPV